MATIICRWNFHLCWSYVCWHTEMCQHRMWVRPSSFWHQERAKKYLGQHNLKHQIKKEENRKWRCPSQTGLAGSNAPKSAKPVPKPSRAVLLLSPSRPLRRPEETGQAGLPALLVQTNLFSNRFWIFFWYVKLGECVFGLVSYLDKTIPL